MQNSCSLDLEHELCLTSSKIDLKVISCPMDLLKRKEN